MRQQILKFLKNGMRKMADRARFELAKRFWRLLAFQASAFGHSATCPYQDFKYLAFRLFGHQLVFAVPNPHA